MIAGSPLKVIVATRLFTPEVGAASFRLQALVDGLVASGAQVRVLTTRPPRGSEQFNPAYGISRWPVLRDSGGNVRGYIQYLSFDIPLFFRLLISRADVVVSEPPPTTGIAVALSSLLRRRPFVYYAADIWTEALSAMEVPGAVVKLMRAFEGFVLRRASKVIAISDAVADQVAQFAVPSDRILTVGNGVDTTVFNRNGEKAVAAAPYFVYTGTMSEWQGADIFIRALPAVLATNPQIAIRFFGQGSDEPHLRELAARLAPGAVHFAGVVPPHEAAAWLRGAAAALVSIKPGQGYDFAKPTKIYAAAGCGTAVIFAGQGEGARVVVENNLGRTAGYDVDSVAAAMTAALTSDDDGGTAADERSQWARQHASLAAAGRLAAAKVISAAE